MGDIDDMTTLKSYMIIAHSEINLVVIRQGLRIGDLRSLLWSAKDCSQAVSAVTWRQCLQQSIENWFRSAVADSAAGTQIAPPFSHFTFPSAIDSWAHYPSDEASRGRVRSPLHDLIMI